MDRGVIVADTDAVIDLLQAEGAHRTLVKLLSAGRLATTAVTVFEIWRGLSSETARDVARRAFRGVRVYPLSDAAAKRAAEIDQLLGRGSIGERDSLIAGVCLAIQRPLLTANVRHFQRVPGLEVLRAR